LSQRAKGRIHYVHVVHFMPTGQNEMCANPFIEHPEPIFEPAQLCGSFELPLINVVSGPKSVTVPGNHRNSILSCSVDSPTAFANSPLALIPTKTPLDSGVSPSSL
jgi:hypothetical protein